MANILLGLSGAIGAGKSDVAAYLADTLSYTHLSFADALRDAASVFFDIPVYELRDRKTKEVVHPVWGITRRRMLTLLGNDVARDMVRSDFWIIKMQNKIYELQQYATDKQIPSKIVIDDVRYDNEKDAIIEAGGHIIIINRPNNQHYVHSTNASEKGISVCDNCTIIQNDGTLEQLYTNVRSVLLLHFINALHI